MAVEKTKDLWVFIETEDEGTAKSVVLELLVQVEDLQINRTENLLQ